MRTIPYSFNSMELVRECVFTLGRLKAHSLTTSMAKDFEDLQASGHKVWTKEMELTTQLALAEAKMLGVDARLDSLLLAITHTLLIAVNNDREAPLYVRIFGSQRPSDVRKPVLGEQLLLMKTWIPILSGSGVSSLKAYETDLTKLVAEGEQAQNEHIKAEEALESFSRIGDFKLWVDSLNALRKVTFGKLSELVHKHPESNLGSEFAESFFLRDRRNEKPSLARIERTIQSLHEQLERQQTLRKEMLAHKEASEKVRVEAEAKQMQHELDALEKAMTEQKAKADELKKKLHKS